MPKIGIFTPRDTHKRAWHLIRRWVWGLKMVPEVIIDIDGTNYTENNLIHESQHFGPTPNIRKNLNIVYINTDATCRYRTNYMAIIL